MSWGFALFGAALPLLYETPLFALHRDRVALWCTASSNPVVTIPADTRELTLLLSGILGGSIAGKWVAHALIARWYLARRYRWARDASIAALVLWFAVDSSVSLALGAAFNVWMINLMPLVVFGVPILWVWGDLANDAPAASSEPSATNPFGRAALIAISALFVVLGLGIAVGFDSRAFGWWFDGLAAAQFSGDLPVHARRLARFFMGPVGGCVAAHFLLLTAATRRVLSHDRKAVRLVFVASIGVWFVIDSATGLLHGGRFNVLSVNIGTLLLVLPPLFVATRAPQAQQASQA